MNRRWLALIVVLMAAMVLAPIVLLLLQRGQPTSGAPAESNAPAASRSASMPADAIAFVDAASPEDAAWYRLGADPTQFPPRLQVGTVADGVTFEVELRSEPGSNPDGPVLHRPVLGIGGGVVVVVEDDGTRSRMRAIVAATGDVHDLLVSDDLIVDGALAADGRTAYFVTADRLSGDLTGAWRIEVGAGYAPEAIEGLISTAPEIRLVAITRLFSRMLLSSDGSTLGLFHCIELDCALRALRTDDGTLIGEVPIQRGGGDPFAITEHWALLRPIAPDGPHSVGEVLDLASGESAPIPIEPWPLAPEAVVAGDDGAVLALQTAGWSAPPEGMGQEPGGPPQVTLVSVDDMQVTDSFELPLSALAIIVEDDYSTGVDLPAGWLLIRGSEPGALVMTAYAMKISDGSLVPLPSLGDFFVQG